MIGAGDNHLPPLSDAQRPVARCMPHGARVQRRPLILNGQLEPALALSDDRTCPEETGRAGHSPARSCTRAPMA